MFTVLGPASTGGGMKLGDYLLSVRSLLRVSPSIIVVFVAGALVALFQLHSIDDVAAASGAPLAPGRSTAAPPRAAPARSVPSGAQPEPRGTPGTAIAVSAMIIALTTGIWVIRSVCASPDSTAPPPSPSGCPVAI